MLATTGSWTVSDSQTAAIDRSGLLTGIRSGIFDVTASVGSFATARKICGVAKLQEFVYRLSRDETVSSVERRRSRHMVSE